MKHNSKITLLLIGMFILTQFIGLYVVNYYSPVKVIDGEIRNVSVPNNLPYGMEAPQIEQERDFFAIFPSIIIAFVIAISLLFLLQKFKAEIFLRAWFFVVVVIALGISLNAIIGPFWNPTNLYLYVLAIAIPLAFVKIYKGNFFVHNSTELFIYPGIAGVFVSLLNIWTLIGLLILISIYDIWAVWHSGIMQKMAKYQIDTLKIFSGFFVPHLSKKQRADIKLMKSKKVDLSKKKFKVNIAILGGGDVVFPIIASGVALRYLGFWPAILVILGATLGLSYLLLFAEKKKFYPAMPYISAGIFAGFLLGWILF